ncbi:MAG: leucine-rich repeat domain-containing protein [Prevotella sp.]|nr:leucine-rich repeat domain-containing protein [Prevotella sp.]
MKKVLFTSILLLSAVSFGGNIYAHDTVGGNNTEVTTTSESSASVEFKASEDGKTLTISGYGDLTSYSTKENKTVFSSEAKDKISTQSWGGDDLTGKTYDASATYYYLSGYKWVKIDNNEAYFKQNPSLLKEKTVDVDFSTKLAQTITSGNFETVKFENNSSSNALTINSNIIGKILFIEKSNWGQTWEEINEKLKELDLGQAICTDLSSETFSTGKNSTANLTTLTLPLTVKTSVMSELTSTNVEKMVLPSKVLGNYYPDITTVTIPEGYDRLGEDAFLDRSKISTFNLPSSLTLIGKAAFKNCAALASIKLNNGLQNIGKEAFTGTKLTSIDFPSSLKIINDCAFANCHIYNLKFNAGLKYIGNSAFALSNEQTEKVLEIPASVIYIGPYAFNFRQYQDVYFYGEKAPLMPLGSYKLDTNTKDLGTAFPQQTLNGNNGFNPIPEEGEEKTGDDTSSGYANRENYKNNGVYLCMLHYPKGLSDENRDTYTDITRVYKTYRTADGKFIATDTGADEATDNVGKEGADRKLDAGLCLSFVKVTWGYADTYLGEQYIWPSQSQFNRAYCTASHSVKWDGVTPVTCDLSAEEIAALKYAGYETSEQNLDELKKIAHMGTRQFVLANADAFVDGNPEEEPEYPVDIKGGEWWTICLPFNMTKAMVDETFGKDTQVCLFDRVSRQVNRDTKKNRIVLYFTQNVYKHKTEPKKADGYWNFQETAAAPTDDDIVIYAHESYMIHPTKTGEDAVFAVKNYQPVVGNPTPTVVMGKNEYTGESDTPDNVPYRYVGNYLENVDTQVASQSDTQTATQALTEVKVPKFSYVYASDGKETKFWFLTSDDMTWKPNKCVVQTNTRGDGQNDYEEFFDYTVSSAKQSSFFGEDFIDTPTSIDDEMVIIAGEGSDAPVYSLDGTLVNTTGDLTGLPKGVYIKGGKKYVVK